MNGTKRTPNGIPTEILAPAGSLESLYAAICAGADAVYMGGNKFGARAYAENPEETKLLEAIDYVHLHGKKIYLTVNTLLKNKEVEQELYDYLTPYYQRGLDAVIVQDFGVFSFIKKHFPDLDLHASTQMAITGVYGAKLLKDTGASRIVTARELSLEEIKQIHDAVDIEIESFVHGAMCYSYSGQCLFSSMLGGRSGNRGRCAGPCRQPYDVYKDGRKWNNADSQYVLSLRDMNTLSILPQIIEAGVYSLKIEGRMKSAEYAAGTVELYRKYVDLYHSFSSKEDALANYRVEKQDMDKLAGLYSRSGSCTGYYLQHNSKNMVSVKKPAYQTESESYVKELKEKYVEQTKKYHCHASLELQKNQNSMLKIYDSNGNEIIQTGEVIEPAMNRPTSEEDVKKQISKTGATAFIFDSIQIQMDTDVFVPVKQLNELRRTALERFQNLLLDKHYRPMPLKQQTRTITQCTNREPFIHCYITKKEQFEVVITQPEVQKISISTDNMTIDEVFECCRICIECKKEPLIAMPYIFRKQAISQFESVIEKMKQEFQDGDIRFLVRTVDEIGFLSEHQITGFQTDYLVYAFNYYGADVLKDFGAGVITYPYELNEKELRNFVLDQSECIVYGNIPLMITANCINQTIKKCDKTASVYYLKDRLQKQFPVTNICNYCYNIIYNNQPLSLFGVEAKLKQINPAYLRFSFTLEDATETKEILKRGISACCKHQPVQETEAFTRGHFKRGVI